MRETRVGPVSPFAEAPRPPVLFLLLSQIADQPNSERSLDGLEWPGAGEKALGQIARVLDDLLHQVVNSKRFRPRAACARFAEAGC